MVTPRITAIVQELKQTVAEKYAISDMRLFGSHARGEEKEGSDIDIFLQVPTLTKEIEQDIYNLAYDLELKYNHLIDVILLSGDSCYLPIHQEILKEGVSF